MNNKTTGFKTLDMVYIAMFAALIAICSWISIPTEIPFTLQTFGVFCAVGLLGGKRGSIAVLVYILLGALGAPVFAGFRGGVGVLLGNTGGYIVGFLISALIFWFITTLFGTKVYALVAAMLVGLLVCYAFGTAWFMNVYAQSKAPVGVATVIGWCIIPYIIPDLVKIALATVVIKRLGKYVKL